MGDEEKNLHIRVSFDTDEASARKSADAVKKQKQAASQTGDEQTRQNVNLLRINAALTQGIQLTRQMQAVTSQISNTFIGAAKSYVEQAKLSTSTSRAWLQVTYDLEKSTFRMGKVATDALLPAYKAMGDLAGKAADFVDKNPTLAKIVVGTGVGLGTAVGGVAAVGTAGLGVMNIIKLLGIGGKAAGAAAGAGAGTAAVEGAAVAGAVPAVTGAGTVAATAGGVTLAGVASAVLGGVTLGLIGDQVLANTKIGKKLGIQGIDKILTVAAYKSGQLIGKIGDFVTGQDTGDRTAIGLAGTVARLTGAVPPTAGLAQNENKGPERTDTLQMLQAYQQFSLQEAQINKNRQIQLLRQARDFQRQETYAQEDYNRTLYRSHRDFERQELYAVADYQKSVYRENRDYNRQLIIAENAFNRERAIAARDFGIQMVRNEQDFQRSRSRANEDHEFDMFQIALSGDAMQYWLAQRRFGIDKKRAEEDYNISKTRAEQDYERQRADSEKSYQIQREINAQQFQITLSDQAQDFGIQRARSLEQFNISLADQAQDFGITRDRSRAQFQITLQDQADDFSRERSYRRQQFELQILPAIQDEFTLETRIRQDMIGSMWNDYNTMKQAALNGNLLQLPGQDVPSHKAGGYTQQGLAMLHANEFVLDQETTQSAERIANARRLTQDTVLSLMTGGGGGITWNDHRTFDSSLSTQDRRTINQDTQETILAALGAR